MERNGLERQLSEIELNVYAACAAACFCCSQEVPKVREPEAGESLLARFRYLLRIYEPLSQHRHRFGIALTVRP